MHALSEGACLLEKGLDFIMSVKDTLLEGRLVNCSLLTPISMFDQQLCLNLTKPNYA